MFNAEEILDKFRNRESGYFDEITLPKYQIVNLLSEVYLMGHKDGLNEMHEKLKPQDD